MIIFNYIKRKNVRVLNIVKVHKHKPTMAPGRQYNCRKNELLMRKENYMWAIFCAD